MSSEKGGVTVVKKGKEGFSLVEMLLAMAILVILLSGLVALISYSTRSMRVTQARVALQDEAKDALNHISAYVLSSGATVTWDDTGKVLTVRRENIEHAGASASYVDSVDAYVYWVAADSSGEKHLYFSEATAKDPAFDPKDKTQNVDASLLTADSTCLLADDVNEFTCELKKAVDDAERQVLHIKVTVKDEISEFACEKDIMMRNQ